MFTPHADSAAFLKEVFNSKTRTNPRFSLRAFAKVLGLSPGGLSLILSRKKRLSFERAHDIATRLNLDAPSVEQFILLVQTDGAGNTALKAQLQEKLHKLQGGNSIFDLGIDQFKLISDWYGLPVLILFTEVKDRPGRRECAKELGITLPELDATLDRLQRLELLVRTGGTNENPSFSRPDEPLIAAAKKPEDAVSTYYKDLLMKMKESIDEQTPDERISGAQVFAFDPEQLDAVRKITYDYLDALNSLSNKGKHRTELYQAFSQVFRLTQKPLNPNPIQKKKGKK